MTEFCPKHLREMHSWTSVFAILANVNLGLASASRKNLCLWFQYEINNMRNVKSKREKAIIRNC